MARTDNADGYAGPAVLRLGDDTFEVQAELRGHVEPADGRYHWYGRLARNDGLTARMTRGRGLGVLTTGEGSAPCEVSDPDPWERYRVTGTSAVPFRTDMRMNPAALAEPAVPPDAGWQRP